MTSMGERSDLVSRFAETDYGSIHQHFYERKFIAPPSHECRQSKFRRRFHWFYSLCFRANPRLLCRAMVVKGTDRGLVAKRL